MTERDDLRHVLDAIPDLVPRFQEAPLAIYLEEVCRWNPRLGLVSKQNTPSVLADLIRRSVNLWEFLVESTGRSIVGRLSDPEGVDVLDVGTGGGFPGLIWKLLEPRLRVTLVDRISRKIHFLEKIVVRLGLEDVGLIEGDTQQLCRDEDLKERFDVAVAMAVARPEMLGPEIDPMLRTPGYFCTRRASGEEEISPRVSERLLLHARSDEENGIYVLYEKPFGPA